MKPTEILSLEHRVINSMLACLEKITANAGTRGRLDLQMAEEALDFFRNYADRLHHGKEEELLFPVLENLGFPKNAGPTAVMRMEHVTGRNFVKAMARAAKSAGDGDSQAVDIFCSQARGFIAMMREHIVKEDECLFTMADNTLDDHAQNSLLESFGRFEEDEIEAGLHERMVELAMSQATRLDIEVEDGSDGRVEYTRSGCAAASGEED